MFNIFIKRPILSSVISLLIVFLGLLSIGSLPVTQFPDIMPPSVTVTANYVGANSNVLANSVAMQIERALNGIPGMTYMTTVCNNDGVLLTTVFFKVGTDPDIAAVNVQNRVATAYEELPEEVVRSGIIVEKVVNSMLMYLNITSKDTMHNERFMYNFTDVNLLKALKRVDGVAYAKIMGSRNFSMRVWLNPDRMAAFNLSPQDITEALQHQNVEAAPGKTGISNSKMQNEMQYVLQYSGRFTTPEEYGEIVLKSLPDGSLLTLHDVAEIELDAQEYNMTSLSDGRPSAAIIMKQRPESNARQVIKDIKILMEKVKEESFAPGMDYSFAYDVSRFLDASITSVIKTLIEAFLLVSLVVFLFLQDWRSTLIPALAVPVSLVGTFFFMQILGFSINMLTLFALVLAIGIVVDNAIVVVEAVHVKMGQNLSPFDATVAAMKEIGGAIVSITLVMSAVFVPVGFLEGTVGIFYRQFSLTLAVAIVISGVNALTLTPALCAIVLRNHAHQTKKRNVLNRFFNGFNVSYERFSSAYLRGLAKYLDKRVFTWITLIVFFVLTWLTGMMLPSGFIPEEDQGMVYVNVSSPPGATLERTDEILLKIQAAILPVEDVESVSTIGGYSLLTDSDGATYGMGMVNLTDWKDRKKSAWEMMEDFKERVSHIKGAEIEFFFPPAIPGFGNASGFEVQLLDLAGGNIKDLGEVCANFLEALNSHPQLQNVTTGFNLDFPRYLLHADLQKAAQLGVNIDEAMETLQSFVGSFYSTNFVRFGDKYKVMIQAAPEFRANPEDVFRYFAKSKDGEMVPFSNFMTAEKTYGPEQIIRYNMYTSAMLNGEAAPGVSSGQAIAAVEEVAKRILPRGYGIEWAGIAREEQATGNQAIWIFAVCLLFVYLILSAQYESWFLPVPVVLTLPAGVFGTFLFLKILGLENNIYAQVALIMLIGLLGKNVILMIEMANQNRREKGMSIVDAAIQGAISRLRPILMTSFAFIFGLIPLMIATGAGSIGNRSIGTAAAGGMLIGTVAGIFLVPGLYIIFETISSKFKTNNKNENAH